MVRIFFLSFILSGFVFAQGGLNYSNISPTRIVIEEYRQVNDTTALKNMVGVKGSIVRIKGLSSSNTVGSGDCILTDSTLIENGIYAWNSIYPGMQWVRYEFYTNGIVTSWMSGVPHDGTGNPWNNNAWLNRAHYAAYKSEKKTMLYFPGDFLVQIDATRGPADSVALGGKYGLYGWPDLSIYGSGELATIFYGNQDTTGYLITLNHSGFDVHFYKRNFLAEGFQYRGGHPYKSVDDDRTDDGGGMIRAKGDIGDGTILLNEVTLRNLICRQNNKEAFSMIGVYRGIIENCKVYDGNFQALAWIGLDLRVSNFYVDTLHVGFEMGGLQNFAGFDTVVTSLKSKLFVENSTFRNLRGYAFKLYSIDEAVFKNNFIIYPDTGTYFKGIEDFAYDFRTIVGSNYYNGIGTVMIKDGLVHKGTSAIRFSEYDQPFKELIVDGLNVDSVYYNVIDLQQDDFLLGRLEVNNCSFFEYNMAGTVSASSAAMRVNRVNDVIIKNNTIIRRQASVSDNYIKNSPFYGLLIDELEISGNNFDNDTVGVSIGLDSLSVKKSFIELNKGMSLNSAVKDYQNSKDYYQDYSKIKFGEYKGNWSGGYPYQVGFREYYNGTNKVSIKYNSSGVAIDSVVVH